MDSEKEKKKGKIVQMLKDGSVPKEQRVKPSSSQRVSISGDKNIVGDNNTVINTERVLHKTVADVKPGEQHIDDKQAARLHYLVDEIFKIEARLKKKPKTFQAIWKSLNAYIKVPKYRLIPREDFPRAEKYLLKWMGRLNSMKSAPSVDNEAWRKKKYAYIKINTKDDPSVLDRYILKNFGVTTIRDLDDADLEKTYRYIAGKRAARMR